MRRAAPGTCLRMAIIASQGVEVLGMLFYLRRLVPELVWPFLVAVLWDRADLGLLLFLLLSAVLWVAFSASVRRVCTGYGAARSNGVPLCSVEKRCRARDASVFSKSSLLCTDGLAVYMSLGSGLRSRSSAAAHRCGSWFNLSGIFGRMDLELNGLFSLSCRFKLLCCARDCQTFGVVRSILGCMLIRISCFCFH